MKLTIDEEHALQVRSFKDGSSLTCKDLYNLYLYIYSKKNKITSLFRVNRIFTNHFFKVVDINKKVINLTISDFDSYRARLIEENINDPNSYISHVKDMFKLYEEYYSIHIDGAFKILPIRKNFNNLEKKLTPKYIYELEDFKKIYKACNSAYERVLVLLLFFLGLRIGELRALKWNSIKDNHILISQQATSKIQKGCQIIDPKSIYSVRKLPIPSILKEELEKLKNENLDTIFIFEGRKKLPIGEQTIRRTLTSLAKKANLPYLKPHSFRHSCASYLINELDCSISEVKEWLGHSSTDITSKIYIHLYKDKKEAISKRMKLD